jgi:hypothetical protein
MILKVTVHLLLFLQQDKDLPNFILVRHELILGFLIDGLEEVDQ